MAWTEQSTLFHVGLGFRVGFAGAQVLGQVLGGHRLNEQSGGRL